MVQLEATADVQVSPPGVAVTVYNEIAAPPVEVEAANEMVTTAFPAVTDVMRGALGAVDGTTAAEVTESAERPAAFFERTLNV
jgi:hypothetical protein